MRIQLSDHFTYNKLIRFTMPSVLMFVSLNFFGAVDGFFVSNFAGKTSLAAINLICPLMYICMSLGLVFAAGGTAYISKTLGEGDKEKANKSFSLFVYTSIIIGILTGILGILIAEPFARFLGAEGELLRESVLYARIVLIVQPFLLLQVEFEQFFPVSEKPKLSTYLAILAGVLNIILDAIFVAYFKWGVFGVALATCVSILMSGGLPLLYFCFPNNSLLRLCRCEFDFKALTKAFLNGISEFVSSISGSIVAFLYNYQLMRYMGEDGVAAYGVMMYVYFFFLSIFCGYVFGSSPLIGFNFGARNEKELKNLLYKSLSLIFITSLILFSISEIFATQISHIFVGYENNLQELSVVALKVCSIAFLVTGFNIFSSSFFTALSDGITSAKIAFMHSFILEPGFIILIPIYFGKNSIWWAMVFAETVSVFVCIYYFIKKRNLYLHPNPDY